MHTMDAATYLCTRILVDLPEEASPPGKDVCPLLRLLQILNLSLVISAAFCATMKVRCHLTASFYDVEENWT